MICFRVDKFKSKNMSHSEENHIRNNLHDLKMRLELKTYGHLRDDHSLLQAAKVLF